MKKIITFLMIMLCFNSLATGGTSLDGIQLKDLNNKTVTLGKYKGKKVYIKMWASWCPTCLAGLHEINSLSADEKGEVLKKAQIRGYPSNIILDSNSNIIKVLPGHLNAEQIKEAVK